MFPIPDLSSTLNVLSAMVTPAVLILATGSLILTTTNRLVRVIDRVREMLPEFESLAKSENPDETKRKMLFEQLDRATIRARLAQRALTQLYLGLTVFLATSVALGVVAFARLDAAWIPLLLGVIGVGLLLNASVLLIIETRIALASTYSEMDYIRKISHVHAPPELKKGGMWWRMFG